MSVPTPNVFDRPVPVALARALAEAADGLPAEFSPIYLASAYEPVAAPLSGGFRVYGPYKSVEELPEWLQKKIEQGEYGVFGPFTVTPGAAEGSRVTGLELKIDGKPTFSYPVLPDAVFLSAAAVEKFALPYYERIFGPEFAEKMSLEFQVADIQAMAHYPWSEYTDGTRIPAAPMFLRSTPSGIVPVRARAAAGAQPPGPDSGKASPGGVTP